MTIETVEGYIGENKLKNEAIVKAKRGRIEYPMAVVVDWKENVVEAISQVNDVLKEKGIDLVFTHVDCGSDQEVFITDYKPPRKRNK